MDNYQFALLHSPENTGTCFKKVIDPWLPIISVRVCKLIDMTFLMSWKDNFGGSFHAATSYFVQKCYTSLLAFCSKSKIFFKNEMKPKELVRSSKLREFIVIDAHLTNKLILKSKNPKIGNLTCNNRKNCNVHSQKLQKKNVFMQNVSFIVQFCFKTPISWRFEAARTRRHQKSFKFQIVEKWDFCGLLKLPKIDNR